MSKRGQLRRYISLTVLTVAALPLAAAPVWPWGDEGHQIVCAIAYAELEPADQAEVNRLTQAYRLPDGGRYTDFPRACTFADLARTNARAGVAKWSYFNRFNNWHFLNVPRDTRQIDASHCGGDCVLKGIDYHSGRLADTHLDDWKRGQALCFLAHWVGDVHQPLHVSYADDLGGNKIKPIRGDYYTSADLHAVWDSGIIRRAHAGSWQAYATKLRGKIPSAERDEWLAAEPRRWAQESYDITIQHDVDYCEWESDPDGDWCRREFSKRTLTSSYQKKFQDDVERRLQQAGVRLAARVRRALHP